MAQQQVLLRLVVLVAPVGAALCASAAGAGLLRWTLPVVAVLTLLGARRPDSHWPATSFAVVGGYWLLAAPRSATAWALVAGLLLLAAHAAAALAALGPAGLRLDPLTARTWARRLVLVSAGTVLAWLVAVLLHHGSPRGHLVLTIAALLVLAAVLGLTARAADPDRG